MPIKVKPGQENATASADQLNGPKACGLAGSHLALDQIELSLASSG